MTQRQKLQVISMQTNDTSSLLQRLQLRLITFTFIFPMTSQENQRLMCPLMGSSSVRNRCSPATHQNTRHFEQSSDQPPPTTTPSYLLHIPIGYMGSIQAGDFGTKLSEVSRIIRNLLVSFFQMRCSKGDFKSISTHSSQFHCGVHTWTITQKQNCKYYHYKYCFYQQRDRVLQLQLIEGK